MLRIFLELVISPTTTALNPTDSKLSLSNFKPRAAARTRNNLVFSTTWFD